MAEYKAKLLKGLIQAKNVFLGEKNLENVLTKKTAVTTQFTINANSSYNFSLSANNAFAIVGIHFSVAYIETCSFRAANNQLYVSCRNPNTVAENVVATIDYLSN